MRIARTAALAVMMFGAATAGAGFSDAAYAAAAADIDPGADESAATYQLDTVLVVHNWVLCTSRDSAERLARAREAGTVVAQQAYAELAAAKTCGKFKKLGVMLHAPLYRSAPGNTVDARVFGALVNIGAGWHEGVVVAGDAPE